MDRSRVAYSNDSDFEVAFEQIRSQLDGNDGASPLLIIFTSTFGCFSRVSKMFKEAYPDTISIGSSTYINYNNKGYSTSAVSALAVYSGIELAAGVLHDIATYPMRYSSIIEDAVAKMSNTENTICFELTSAFLMCEELVQDTFKSVLEPRNIPVFGGSAGAPDWAEVSMIALNGEVYQEACVFVMIKNLCGRIYQFQDTPFEPTNASYIVTDVDCEDRMLYELDGRPAAETMSRALELSETELNQQINSYPLGRIEDDKLYVTQPGHIFSGGRMNLFASMYNQIKVYQLKMGDILAMWKKIRGEINEKVMNPAFMVVINCEALSAYITGNQDFEDLFGQFSDELNLCNCNYVGISGHGEQAGYEHFNQTVLMMLFE